MGGRIISAHAIHGMIMWRALELEKPSGHDGLRNKYQTRRLYRKISHSPEFNSADMSRHVTYR